MPSYSKPLNVLVWSVALTTILAALLGGATMWLLESTRAREQSVIHTRDVHELMERVLLLVQRMESSQRGYLLVGREAYLDSYEKVATELPLVIDEVARLVADNPQQRQAVARLRVAVSDKVSELRSTIVEQRAGHPDAARAIVNSDRGLKLVELIRQILSDMMSEEERLLAIRRSALEWAGRLLKIGTATAFLTICALGVLVGLYTRRSFAQLTDAIEASERGNLRHQLAMYAAKLGWWQYDAARHVISGDARFQQIFGIAESETTGEGFMRRIHADDMEQVRAALARALDAADPRPMAIEFRLRPEDGRMRWVETHAVTSVRGARHPARVIGTVADITKRKEDEEKAGLITREMSHRAKNMLSVVDAIAHRIAAGHPQDFARQFSERIQALAANQDLLIRNEWKGVDIEDLVRAQLAHFAGLIGSRITFKGPRLRLRGVCAQAIGLAVHELATNAGKYGALQSGDGRIEIEWGCDGTALTMSWIERGGPPVSPSREPGFGTTVMKTMAERSLGGVIELEYPRSGVTWRLTCAAEGALEPGSETTSLH